MSKYIIGGVLGFLISFIIGEIVYLLVLQPQTIPPTEEIGINKSEYDPSKRIDYLVNNKVSVELAAALMERAASSNNIGTKESKWSNTYSGKISNIEKDIPNTPIVYRLTINQRGNAILFYFSLNEMKTVTVHEGNATMSLEQGMDKLQVGTAVDVKEIFDVLSQSTISTDIYLSTTVSQ